MKSLLLRSSLVAISAVLVCVLVQGCRRAPVRPDKGPEKRGEEFDPGRDFLDAARYEPARAGNDWRRIRDFLPKLASHFAKPEIQALRRLPDDVRKYLADEVHLTSAELVEVEAFDFRLSDAHYLDECFLFRDVARSLDAGSLDSTEKQADALFGWVTRNVFLHEQVDSWIPPAFTLRRGHGGAVERALVFLALARQERLDGCLLVVPNTDPLQFLVGVLDAKAGSVLLFDPRLGLRVAGKDGKSVATLKEVQDDPNLLGPSQITPAQAKKLEAWLVCPYHALSPRMQEVEGELDRLEKITVYQNPLALAKAVRAATGITVKVWNPPADGQKLVNSPTRCLDLFLPKEEGGQDTTRRAAVIAQTRVPSARVAVSFAQLNVTAQLVPAAVYGPLTGVADDLFVKYDLHPREMYLRGQYEAMRLRQDRLGPFKALVGMLGDKEFDAERADWFKLINEANANLENRDPVVRARAKQVLESLGGADILLHWLIDVESEKKLAELERELREAEGKTDQERSSARSVPTKILAAGLRDHFELEHHRMLAAASHEKAQRAQAAGSKRAHELWIPAKTQWANFYLAPIVIEFIIDQRLEQMRTRVHPLDIDSRLNLVEALHLDVQRCFNAKLRLAECLVHTHSEGVNGANAYRAKIKHDIEQIEKKGLLREEIRSLQDSLPRVPMSEAARTMVQRRLDLLARDWSEHGTYFWMKQQLDQRMGKSS